MDMVWIWLKNTTFITFSIFHGGKAGIYCHEKPEVCYHDGLLRIPDSALV